jgi:hypothetical protein
MIRSGSPWSSGSRATRDGNTHRNSYPPCWGLSLSTQHGQRIHARTPAQGDAGAHTKHSLGVKLLAAMAPFRVASCEGRDDVGLDAQPVRGKIVIAN